MKYDLVVIGGGESGCRAALDAAKDGRRVCLVTEGLTLRSLEPEFKHKPYAMLASLLPAGVAVMRGDKVLGGRWEGSRLKEVFTANGITLQAGEFILATGRFFSGGLAASMDRIYEPVFGADVTAPQDRSLWYDSDIRKPQPFENFGVRTTADGHILIDGKAADNVKAVGKILAKDYAGQ